MADVYDDAQGQSKDPEETVDDLLNDLLDGALPDALDQLLYRGLDAPEPSAFERFAAEQLEAAGAERIRAIAAAHELTSRRLTSTGLFWMVYEADELSAEELDVLQAVDGALNRLALAARTMTGEDGSSRLLSATSDEACALVGEQLLWAVANVLGDKLAACESQNPLLSVAEAHAARGGEWDVRTRFAANAETLSLPFSLDYRFDCDARAGVVEVDASVPAASAFTCAPEADRPREQAGYALRLAACMASVAFGAGVGVVRAVVHVRERTSSGTPLCSLEFSRRAFKMRVVPRAEAGDLQGRCLSPERLLKLLAPRFSHVEFGEAGGLRPVDPINAGLPIRTMTFSGSTEPLPPALAQMLGAQTLGELDIFDRSDDALAERFAEVAARADADDPTAVAELADIVGTIETVEALEADDRTPLYCTSMVGRVQVSARSPEVRFRKVPDSSFDARHVLCRLYRERGNREDALRLGKACVELAPTAFIAHHSLAAVYMDAERWSEAVPVLCDALRSAATPSEVSVGYYRLAFALWNSGDPTLGLACYAMVHPMSPFGAAAAEEVAELMQHEHIAHAPTYEEAQAALRAAGIPIAPVDELAETVAKAAVELVDARMFAPAVSLVMYLSTLRLGPNSNDVLAAVSRSLRP